MPIMNEIAFKKVCIFHYEIQLDSDMVVENEREVDRWQEI